MEEAVAPSEATGPLARECERLLALLRKNCPGLLPQGPLPAGEIANPIDLGDDELQRLLLASLGTTDRRRRNRAIWEHAGSELLVHFDATRIAVLDGIVLVGMVVETVETGKVEVTVPFAVGTPEALAGMVVTTEPKPRGPIIVIDRWGEALIAAAWQAVLDVVSTISARTGVDERGDPLLPGAIVAWRGVLRVVPQAAHAFEGTVR